MLPRQRLQHVGGQGRGVQRLPQSVLDAVVVAVGVGAGFRRTFAHFLQADLVPCCQCHAAQRQRRGVPAQKIQRVFGGGAGGAAGRQVKHRPAFAQGFQGGVEHAHRLADARRRLAQQLAAFAAGLVHRADHRALPRAVTCKGEGQGLQRGHARLPPLRGAFGPGGVLRQQFLHKSVQRFGVKGFGKTVRLFFVDLVIGQPHGHARQALLPGIDGGVHLGLRPVLGALRTGDLLGRQQRRLDLIHRHGAVGRGIDAVGPALQRESDAVAVVPLPQSDLGGVIGKFPHGGALQFAVQARALVGAVKPGKPGVDAAAAQQKFRQPPDGQCQCQRCRLHGGPLLL